MTIIRTSSLDAIPDNLRENDRDYFAYSLTVANLLAGTAVQPNLAMSDDSHFLMDYITGVAANPANPSVQFATPALTLLIVDQGAGRQLENQAVHWGTTVGSAQLPFPTPWPKFFNRGATVQIQLANLDAVQAYTIWITLHGFKIFNTRGVR